MRPLIACLFLVTTGSPHSAVAQNQVRIRLGMSDILAASNSGAADETRLVVRDSVSWALLWPRLVEHSDPMPPLPPVEFPRRLLLVAALGERRSGGFSISIDSVIETPAWILAYVRSTSPGRGCIVTLGFTQPIRIVNVPATTKPITFVELDEHAPSCSPVR